MRIQIQGATLEVEDRGQGRPVLFIHGYPLNRQLWKPQMEGLADIARVITLDLRGHGDSTSTSGAYSMDFLANDSCQVLDALGVREPVVICGLSMGGYVTFAFFRNYPERVAGLVLAATRAGEDTPEGKLNRDKAAELARQGGPGAIAESMLPRMLSPKTYNDRPELVQQVWEIMQNISLDGILGDLMGMKARPDSNPTLHKIDKPTLIIHGSDDQLILLKDAIAMRSAVPGATLSVLPDAGHLLNLEQPELFNQAIRTFMKEYSL
jgi:pimeloyl-ACP methyl ester carboxylesterase